jgi:hypothetical protein
VGRHQTTGASESAGKEKEEEMKKIAPFNAGNRPAKEPDYRTPKKAFDDVMAHYEPDVHIDLFGTEQERSEARMRIDVERYRRIPFYEELPKRDPSKKRGQGTVAARGTVTKNPTTPTYSDFKMDVVKQVRKIIRNRKHLVMFYVRYVFEVETLSKAEQHLFSRYEQQIGRLFMRASIWPLSKYLVSIREKK